MDCLGIEIGGTKLQVVRGDENGRIFQRRRMTVEAGLGAAGIRTQLEQAVKAAREERVIDSVGVGFGGPVDWRTGRIFRSHQIEGWSGFDLRAWLHGLTGATVLADNDANVAALGEARLGAGARGADPVFYVTLGSGVGGGLIHKGAIYHGAVPGEAEIGHVRLDREGTIVESLCSGWAVDARIREACRETREGALCRATAGKKGGEAKHLGAALAAGDPLAERILSTTAEDLAFALSHAVHLFHPELIILGGGLAGVGEPLREKVAEQLPRFLMKVFGNGPRIALAALGEDAVPAGALLLNQSVSESRQP